MKMQGRFLRCVRRGCLDESGQDIVEYALLASIIAIAGIVFLPTIATKMGANFSGWGNAVHNLWTPSDPASASP
jgi:Flp pilus assembly pilin Flp